MCEELAERLAGAGWNVSTTSDKLGKIERLLDMTTTAWRFRSAYRIAHVDVFSGRAFAWAEAVCWVLRRAGKPFVLTLHGGNLPNFAARWPRRIDRLLNSAAMVTTPSRYLLENMASYRRDDIQLIPNPIETSKYEFRQRSTPSPRLIWLRAFREIYNPSLAPRVLSLLLREFPEATLTMVGHDTGDGSLQETLRVAAQLGVSDQLHVEPGVNKSEVPLWLNRGDLLINTTNVDNTPVSILEAMTCGLCIVSTNAGGIPYLLRDEVDSLLVPPNDADAMACSLTRILKEPKLAESLSGNAHNRAMQFDWSTVMPQWESLFAGL